MQRGVQAVTPDLDSCDSRSGDPFTSPRSSGDFSRRISAVMAPTRSGLESSSRQLPSRISTDVSSPPLAAPGASSRNIYQRRVSLPCIIESPSSPVASNLPRQSCDLGRPPMSTEPLHSRNKSTDFHFPGTPSRLSNIFSLNKTQQLATTQTTLPSSSSANIPPVPKHADPTVPPVPGGRRRSVDLLGTGFLSPRTALAVNRRKSLDQLRAVTAVVSDTIIPEGRTADKTRRDSDASTSETIVSSGQSSCSTLVHPMMAMAGNDSRTQLDKIQSPSSSPGSNGTLIVGSSETKDPTADMISASSLVALRRASSASEPGFRSSLDLSTMTSSRPHNVDMRARHRRSMQEPLGASFFSPPSASSLQDTLSRSPKLDDNGYVKQRGSFSGSATVSGRFSRFWSYASGRESLDPTAIHSKDNSAGSLGSVTSNNNEVAPWTMSDMGDGYYFSEKDVPASDRKSRNGVMNRLSGLWSRR